MSGLEQYASKLSISLSGHEGSMGIFAIDDDKIVTSTNMKASAYTIAAQPTAPCLISVLATAVGAADTLGTLEVVGTDIDGVAQTETITPISGTTVYSTKTYSSITSITGVDWVIGEGNDTIKIGVADVVAPTGYYFCALQILADVVVASQTAYGTNYEVALSDFTKLSVGNTYPLRASKIALTSGEAIAYLARV